MSANTAEQSLRISRYESPCGVMRSGKDVWDALVPRLRIPMRGYESVIIALRMTSTIVTNPHAGL